MGISPGRLRGLHTINCEDVTGDLKTGIIRSSLTICKICLQLPSEPSVIFPCVVISWGTLYSIIGERFFKVWFMCLHIHLQSTSYNKAQIPSVLFGDATIVTMIYYMLLMLCLQGISSQSHYKNESCLLSPSGCFPTGYGMLFSDIIFCVNLFKRFIFNVSRGMGGKELPPVRGLLGYTTLLQCLS